MRGKDILISGSGIAGLVLAWWLGRYVVPNKTVVVFPIRHSGDAAVIFLFRPTRPLGLQHDDVKGQSKALQTTFRGESWEVPHLLDRLTGAKDFYFESLDQITMQSWHRGRIALVGDAAYCPAPAVGGGTSLAVIGAYTLARELAEAKATIAGHCRAITMQRVTWSTKAGSSVPRSLRALFQAPEPASIWGCYCCRSSRGCPAHCGTMCRFFPAAP